MPTAYQLKINISDFDFTDKILDASLTFTGEDGNKKEKTHLRQTWPQLRDKVLHSGAALDDALQMKSLDNSTFNSKAALNFSIMTGYSMSIQTKTRFFLTARLEMKGALSNVR